MFKKIFGKKRKSKAPKGFHSISIKDVVRETSTTVKIILNIPSELQQTFDFVPGQYINFAIDINGKQERRSYSICSGKEEDLAVAVKQVENGKVSTWFNQEAKAEMEVLVSAPEGNFIRKSEDKNIVAIAAGSGITPILSMAKNIEKLGGNLRLFYGSRTEESILFKSEIDALSNTFAQHFLSSETREGYESGRISKENFTEIIKGDLSILKADGFFLCGPEQMIFDCVEILKMFGVEEEKIHYELFTTPTLFKSETADSGVDFQGTAKVEVHLDDDSVEFEVTADGATILDKVIDEGLDAPYSCRGGVCSACKAKVTEGKVKMDLNYSLTDQEVADGYTLTCQAHPCSEKVVITYDV